MLGQNDQQESETSDGKPMGTRVLVVEDCSDTAHVCARLLRLSGFDVAVALSGFEALKLATEFQPRVACSTSDYPISMALRSLADSGLTPSSRR